MVKMHLSELSNHWTRRFPKPGHSVQDSGWDIDSLDAPFDYIFVHTSHKGEVNKVNSIDEIAARFIASGGHIIRPILRIPGVGSLIACEDAAGHLFSFIEEELSQGL
ncbi:hypothetical protein Ga0123461_1482 [Mariprofundus aestuarium]|uniref:Uncharacterized protein n=1 Tax=Mariprofundus aestuarium TaxID=1921086 RepID=A0A2K8L6M6_MARES|nr:hypothetical protein Ga0123461_1482 [Mariprofundus aestuarium]